MIGVFFGLPMSVWEQEILPIRALPSDAVSTSKQRARKSALFLLKTISSIKKTLFR
jgi:hypothetical protein